MQDKAFIEALYKIEGMETEYMWGTFGALITPTLIKTKRNQYPSWYTASKVAALTKLVGKGVFAFDCIGLIKGILWGWNGNKSMNHGGAKYGSNGVPDTNANGFFKNLCKGQSSDFSTIVPGEAVWMNGHIGVYVGNGKVIEATPSWSGGVQLSACLNIRAISGLNGRKWTSHGRIPFIEYVAPQANLAGPSVSATALNIRDGAGADNNIVATLKNGDRVKVIDTKDGWVQIAAWVSSKYLTMSKGKVTASVLNVRSGPGTNYEVKSQLKTGNVVEVLAKTGDWYQIPQGYVHSNYIILL